MQSNDTNENLEEILHHGEQQANVSIYAKENLRSKDSIFLCVEVEEKFYVTRMSYGYIPAWGKKGFRITVDNTMKNLNEGKTDQYILENGQVGMKVYRLPFDVVKGSIGRVYHPYLLHHDYDHSQFDIDGNELDHNHAEGHTHHRTSGGVLDPRKP